MCQASGWAAADDDASWRHTVGISKPMAKAQRVDESCHMLTTRPYLCMSKLAPVQDKINPDSQKSSKSTLPVVFPPLASPIYAVINAGREAKTLLCWAILHLWTRWESVLEVTERERRKPINIHSSFPFFFLSSHTRDLNFCVYNEPPTSINDLINIFSTASRSVDKT